MMVLKIIPHAAQVVASNKKKTRSSLRQRGSFKNKANILHQPAFQAAPPTCPLHVWKGGQGQRRVIVLKIMSQTFGKTITDCSLATGMFSTLTWKEFELVEAKKNHQDIVGVFLSRDVVLES